MNKDELFSESEFYLGQLNMSGISLYVALIFVASVTQEIILNFYFMKQYILWHKFVLIGFWCIYPKRCCCYAVFLTISEEGKNIWDSYFWKLLHFQIVIFVWFNKASYFCDSCISESIIWNWTKFNMYDAL